MKTKAVALMIMSIFLWTIYDFISHEEQNKIVILSYIEKTNSTIDENIYHYKEDSKVLFGIKSGGLIFLVVDGSKIVNEGYLSSGQMKIDWGMIKGKKTINVSELPLYLDDINR
jgi:hypothetical protein